MTTRGKLQRGPIASSKKNGGADAVNQREADELAGVYYQAGAHLPVDT